ncbi:DUF4309 domain-containing protein [Paenibacillus algorifonticola]|uniref:DUF4309 domain-containing protein n=1 Tax=Paenibacillus algorifonticola TaxID=684063 RepID=UPI001E4D32D1|nr:DUF4309 domain-containing protein [Paenibacillus algorifonticola]
MHQIARNHPLTVRKQRQASSPAAGQAGQTGQASQVSETPSIGQLVDLAKEGKILEVKYAAHIALFDEIEQDWGKADSTEAAGKGIYAAYTKRASRSASATA